MESIYKELIKTIDKDRVLINEPMSKHTSFRIGGPADLFIKVNDVDELNCVLKVAKKNNIAVTCIGNGSNTLVKDKGIRGITIKLNFTDINVNGDIIEVGSGVAIPVLAKVAYDNSLTGLEFASGIPGTVGGAIAMNAGAYDGEFGNIVVSTKYMDENLEVHTITKEEQEFSYRHSFFSTGKNIIISTIIKLEKGNKEEIKEKMQDDASRRKEKQPLNFPSAGSVFKRKSEYIPAQIIDKCGLKGYNINDAYVSKLHAGFIVNKGNATADDVLKLIEHIKKVVKEKYKVDLELEIKVIGE